MKHNHTEYIEKLALQAENKIRSTFEKVDLICRANTEKVMRAFHAHRVDESMFGATSGYGYNDKGRETLDQLWATVFGAEAALVRHSIASGTHAIAIGLFALLRPRDIMLCVTGQPYDTILSTIGVHRKNDSSLAAYGVKYQQIELTVDEKFDFPAIEVALAESPKVVYIQRSGGYSARGAISCADIGELVQFVRARSDAFIVVDNCYGEFVETTEPTDHGVDLAIGSLIKNPGGGMAESGGYLVGSRRAVDLCAQRLTAPGVGGEVGATLGQNKSLFKGLFYAPHTTAQALKTAIFASALFEELGFVASPKWSDERYDIVQKIELATAENLCAFCRGLQTGSPIDSYVTPIPWDMPGYDNQVIMAAGAFTSGASIELSADGPLRAPFTAYLQGGLTYESGRIGIMAAARELLGSLE